ncbi:MAG: CRISPR-associated endonuclease Cas2 [Promethearchaeota archaeon]
MRYLVIYDIPVEYDPIRKKISDLLLSYNMVRLNYSVFYGILTKNRAEEIAMRLERIVKKIEADVRVIPVCNACHQNVITVKSKFKDGYKIIEDILFE